MCGRFSIPLKLDALAAITGAEPTPLARKVWRPRWSVGARDLLPIATAWEGTRRLGLGRFGWTRSDGDLMLNSRQESLTGWFYDQAMRQTAHAGRAVIPCAGTLERGRHGSGHYIHARDGRPLLLAALWRTLREKGETVTEVSLLTREDIHSYVILIDKRAPIALEPADVDTWLGAPSQALARQALDQPVISFAFERLHPDLKLTTESPQVTEPFHGMTAEELAGAAAFNREMELDAKWRAQQLAKGVVWGERPKDWQ